MAAWNRVVMRCDRLCYKLLSKKLGASTKINSQLNRAFGKALWTGMIAPTWIRIMKLMKQQPLLLSYHCFDWRWGLPHCWLE